MSSNNLIFKNSLFLIIRTLVISLVGFFSVRELLKLLGVEEYGLFNLVFGIATLFAFINGAMISSSQRYLSYYIGKKDHQLLEQAWKSSVILHAFIGLIVVLLLFFFKNLILNSLLVIEIKYKELSQFIYFFSIISIFISILQAPFNALVLAYERMSFFAILSLCDAIVKLGIIYLLYIISTDILKSYTALYVLSNFLILLIYVFYCYKNFNKKLKYGIPDLKILREMFSYSMWNIFGNFSFVAKTQGINIILNIFFGVVANSAYAITNIVISVIGNLINSIVTAINPQIYKSFANQEFERNNYLINSASKFSFFLCFLVVLPILFHTRYLLELWLNEIPLYLVDFVQLALIVLLIDCLSGSLMTGIQATGKVKIYQIVVSISVFLNLPLSYLGLRNLEDPLVIYWIALLMSLISLGLRLYFLSYLIKFNIVVYLKSVIIKIILVVLSSLLVALLISKLVYTQYIFLSFMIFSFIIVMVILFNIYIFGLSTSEKKFVSSKISGYLK
ncbi:oligosaccharide flippase family protein [Acinetobacter sp.]|uniref:oligosaccharide flippase family protein n=1 Tax=Acinetobacter sp. TaxID=472 RepID=UPI003C7730DB